MQIFTIEQRIPTDQTTPLLSLGESFMSGIW